MNVEWKAIEKRGASEREVERFYRVVRDFLRAAEHAWGEAWGHISEIIRQVRK